MRRGEVIPFRQEIGHWTYRRGMAQAGWGWRWLTVTVLLVNWALVSFGAYAATASG